ISALQGRGQFTVGFLDTQRHFGAYNSGMLPPHGAAEIATSVVQQHEADQNVFAALTDFVTEVKQQAGQGGAGETAGQGAGGETARPASHALRDFLIGIRVLAGIAPFWGFVIWRPIRKRRQQELKDAKLAAQDDLIALSNRLTDRNVDVSIQSNPEAAEEQAAALTAYERGTAALDSARSVKDMGAVSRSIAEGQYHLASADALAPVHPPPDGDDRASATRGTACQCVMSTGYRPAAGPAAPSRPAPTARARSTRASSPNYATWRSTARRSATSTPASPRPTGGVSASAPACS